MTPQATLMEPFHDLMRHVRDNGIRQVNSRTGEAVRFIPGHSLRFNMTHGVPAITTKKLFFKAAKGELFGFFRGYQSAAQFREELGCKVWDDNANVTPSWLANPARTGVDDVGRIYGAQWTDWRDWRTAHSLEEAMDLGTRGYSQIAHDPTNHTWVFRRSINQLEEALRTILINPTDRGILVTGWRPDEFDQMCLRPCHVDYQFMVDTDAQTLHLAFFQRSWDLALGFNTVLGAVFLGIMAHLAGLAPGILTQHLGHVHLYDKHLEGVETMLSREHFTPPTLSLGSLPARVSVDDIPGLFARLDAEQVQLVGYQHHPKVDFEMTA